MTPPQQPQVPEYKEMRSFALHAPLLFIQHISRRRLRDYQKPPVEAILRSVIESSGLSFVVIFPRQSGKNEMQAQIETYLLAFWSEKGGEMVKVSPTWKPQARNAMRRLQTSLQRNLMVHLLWRKEADYIYRIKVASMTFLSGAPESNIVGATASRLLEVDEAQDISIAKYDTEIAPMAAAHNATRVFWGTAWTSRTLLARELRLARKAEEKDGIRRTWVLSADDIATETPSYGAYVTEQVRRLGRSHPSVKTQYFSEEIDSESGMFPPERIALMQGAHSRQLVPQEGSAQRGLRYALLIDVAGEDEAAQDAAAAETGKLANPRRDSTTLTVVEIDPSSLADELIRLPTYRVVHRRAWTGARHSRLYAQVRAQIEHWHARHVVIDATGVGAGLASFLEKAFPGRVMPFNFNSVTKSSLGYAFLAAIETGRFKDYAEMDAERAAFNLQLSHCQIQALEGPQRLIRWGVPDGSRDPASGELVHDDFVLSAALCAALDELPWSSGAAPLLIQAADPLADMDRARF